MVKKCIVEYDELEKPINLIEVKEFDNGLKFKEFKELCEKNKEDFLERKRLEKEKLLNEKKNLWNRIEKLEKKAEVYFEVIKYLLGISENKDILKLFEGEQEDEKVD